MTGPRTPPSAWPRPVAVALGGGGLRGAAQVGMLRALVERGLVPDLVVGTSVGAINGAILALDPSSAGVERLAALWRSTLRGLPLVLRARASALLRGTASGPVAGRDHLVGLIDATFGPDALIEDLAVPFQACAARLTDSTAHWFRSGPVRDALLASAALPGVLPVARVDGQDYLDGGLISPIPVAAAAAAGARTVVVLRAAGADGTLTAAGSTRAARNVSFEVIRRHLLAVELAAVPSDVIVHVVPAPGDLSTIAGQSVREIAQEAATWSRQGYALTLRYLDG